MDIDTIKFYIEYSAQSNDPVPDYWAGLNNEAPYYKFLYFLAQAVKPERIVELGVLHGKGTAHFAAGAPDAIVTGIDLNLPFDIHAEISMKYSNIQWWQGDTLAVGKVLWGLREEIDILFIDSVHEAAHATAEFNLYWPMVKPGGILLADDIYLNDMRSFWEIVPEPKFLSDTLHGTCGFGIAIKQ